MSSIIGRSLNRSEMLPPCPIVLTNGHGKTGAPKTTSIVTGNVNPAENNRKSPYPSAAGRHCSSPGCSCRSPQMSPSLARSREVLKAGMKRKMQFAILEHPQCEDEAAANSGDSMDSVDDDNFCHIIQPGENLKKIQLAPLNSNKKYAIFFRIWGSLELRVDFNIGSP